MRNRRLSKILRLVLILAVVLITGLAVWWFLICQPPIPRNIIVLSGRIEGDDSVIAAKNSGRIRELRVREGDIVKAGDVIALLDDEQAVAREQQAQSALQE